MGRRAWLRVIAIGLLLIVTPVADGTTTADVAFEPANTSLTTPSGPVTVGGYHAGRIAVRLARPCDANADGTVDTGDVIQVQRSIVGLETVSGFVPTAADVTDDGTVDTSDVIQIQRFIVGLSSVLN